MSECLASHYFKFAFSSALQLAFEYFHTKGTLVKFRQLLAMFASLIALMFGAYTSEAIAADDVCWKATYGRGAGAIPDACAVGMQKDGALCYPFCRAGFNGVGPVCWGSCPAGMTDGGVFCAKPKEVNYARTYYTALFGGACDADAKKAGINGCEPGNAGWYIKCKAGYVGNGGVCAVPRTCPAGFADVGDTCTKPSYGRTAGQSMVCGAGKTTDAGLCYDSCKASFGGVGPVCWSKCEGKYPMECGALCATNTDSCVAASAEIVIASLGVALAVADKFLTGGAVAGGAKIVSTASKIAIRAAKAEAVRKAILDAANKIGKKYDQWQVENMVNAAMGEPFDPSVLDPTGIADMIKALAKPLCSLPPSGPILADMFDYLDWDFKQYSVGVGPDGGFRNRRVGEQTLAGGGPEKILYVSTGGVKKNARYANGKFTGFQYNANGDVTATTVTDFIDYVSWDNNVYRVMRDTAANKWKITRAQ